MSESGCPRDPMLPLPEYTQSFRALEADCQRGLDLCRFWSALGEADRTLLSSLLDAAQDAAGVAMIATVQRVVSKPRNKCSPVLVNLPRWFKEEDSDLKNRVDETCQMAEKLSNFRNWRVGHLELKETISFGEASDLAHTVSVMSDGCLQRVRGPWRPVLSEDDRPRLRFQDDARLRPVGTDFLATLITLAQVANDLVNQAPDEWRQDWRRLKLIYDLATRIEFDRQVRRRPDHPATPMKGSRLAVKLPDGETADLQVSAPRQDMFPSRLLLQMTEDGVIGDERACPLVRSLNRYCGEGFVSVVFQERFVNIYHEAALERDDDELVVEGRRPLATYTCIVSTPLHQFDGGHGGRVALSRYFGEVTL